MSDVINVTVKSTKPDGYRRAGFALASGENALEVTEAQYQQIDNDPSLYIEPVDLDAVEPKKKAAK